jgi:hypothetical protein
MSVIRRATFHDLAPDDRVKMHNKRHGTSMSQAVIPSILVQQGTAQWQRRLVRSRSPIELGVLAGLDLADCRVLADGAPDLLLELASGDVIAEEGVV